MKRTIAIAWTRLFQGAAIPFLLLTLNGCIIGALLFGGAAALVIREGFVAEDTYEGIVKTSPGRAYSASIEIMDRLCHKIALEKAFRKVSGSWRGSDVEVVVEDAGGGGVFLRVKSRKFMLADKDTAVEVFQQIMIKIKDLSG